MNCPKCGSLNPDGAKFCQVCGEPLTNVNPSPNAPQPTPTMPQADFSNQAQPAESSFTAQPQADFNNQAQPAQSDFNAQPQTDFNSQPQPAESSFTAQPQADFNNQAQPAQSSFSSQPQTNFGQDQNQASFGQTQPSQSGFNAQPQADFNSQQQPAQGGFNAQPQGNFGQAQTQTNFGTQAQQGFSQNGYGQQAGYQNAYGQPAGQNPYGQPQGGFAQGPQMNPYGMPNPVPKKKINPLYIALPIIAAVVVIVLVIALTANSGMSVAKFQSAAEKNGYTVETGSAKDYEDELSDLEDYGLKASSIGDVGDAVDDDTYAEIVYIDFTDDTADKLVKTIESASSLLGGDYTAKTLKKGVKCIDIDGQQLYYSKKFIIVAESYDDDGEAKNHQVMKDLGIE